MIGGVFDPPPSQQKVSEFYDTNKESLTYIVNYFLETDYETIYINDTKERGMMFAGLENGNIPINDEITSSEINKLMTIHGVEVISKDNNIVLFQLWSSKDKGIGVVYSADGEVPKVQFITKADRLSDNKWYYYEEDFNEWKIRKH